MRVFRRVTSGACRYKSASSRARATALPFGTTSATTCGTNARGINDAGQIVGVYFDASNSEHSFLYSAGTFTTLAEPSGTTIAFGINDAGQTVGEYEDVTGDAHGFLYSGGTFTTLDNPSASTGTLALGINDAGQIVGYYTDVSSAHAFLYSGGF